MRAIIYRGTAHGQLVPRFPHRVISDEEVIPTKQKGALYYVKYELVPNEAFSVTATYGLLAIESGTPQIGSGRFR